MLFFRGLATLKRAFARSSSGSHWTPGAEIRTGYPIAANGEATVQILGDRTGEGYGEQKYIS